MICTVGGRTFSRTLAALVAMLLLTASAVSADVIQIGTFDWDEITPDQEDYLFFCNEGAPCSRFTVTNDFDDLSAAELDHLGLSSSEVAFNDVVFGGVFPGSFGTLFPSLGSFVWISTEAILSASIAFTLPDGVVGTLSLPTLTSAIDDPAPIYLITPTSASVPEPSALALMGLGCLGLAAVARRSRRLV